MRVRSTAAALEAALDRGLLDRLAESPRTADELAADLSLDPTACSRVLEVLCAEGIVTPTPGGSGSDRGPRGGGGHDAGGCYRVPAEVQRELLAPELLRAERRIWAHTPRFLSTGKPFTSIDRGAAYHESTPHLAHMFSRPATLLASRLAPALGSHPAPSVLDVGAGSGVWSLALLEALPRARGRAIDLPTVLPRYLERAEELGLADRVEAVAGDYHTAEPGGVHEVVLLANVLHLESAADAALLVARWAGAVATGGALVVVDMLSEEGEEAVHSAYALHLALRIPHGWPHLVPELRGWLAQAGLGQVERLPLDGESAGNNASAAGGNPGVAGGLGALKAMRDDRSFAASAI